MFSGLNHTAPMIETELYLLRLVQISDTEKLYDLVDRNRARLLKYFPITTSGISTLESTRSYIAQKISEAAKREFFCYLIEEKNTGDLVGMYILKSFNWRIPKCELAYFIDKKYEGKGIISEITKAIVEHCFTKLNLHKIWIETGTDNLASKSVALKNGFKLEGLLRNNFRDSSGNLIDVEYFGMTLEDWLLRE